MRPELDFLGVPETRRFRIVSLGDGTDGDLHELVGCILLVTGEHADSFDVAVCDNSERWPGTAALIGRRYSMPKRYVAAGLAVAVAGHD